MAEVTKAISFSDSDRQLIDLATETAYRQTVAAMGPKAIGRTGGVAKIFYSIRPKDGLRGWHDVYTKQVGTKEREADWQRNYNFVWEKGTRLMKGRARNPASISSYYPGGEEVGEYPGAIILMVHHVDGGWSYLMPIFSGLPDHGDETFDILLARSMYWGGTEQYRRIIAVSDNQLARDLLASAE